MEKQGNAPNAPIYAGQPAQGYPHGQQFPYPPAYAAPQYPPSAYAPAYPQPSHYPPSHYPQPQQRIYSNVARPSQWSTHLCGCCSECFTCCLTCWMPCVAFGQISQKVDDDQSSCFVNGLIYAMACLLGVPCCYSCLYRHKMRAKFGLPEEPCNDCCTHCCCELCALCQEYRELQNRGIDPTLTSQQIPIVMMAPTPPTMH